MTQQFPRAGQSADRTNQSEHAGITSRISSLARALVRYLQAAPPTPALPGDYLEPGFRRRWLGFFLPAAFLSVWLLNLAVGFNWESVGIDARIYYRGSAAWLAGQDPWATSAILGGHPFNYAGLPPTVILLSPLTSLPEDAFVWLWLVLSFVASLVVVRALRLPIVWIAYPPMLFGVMSANPNVVLLAVLLAGGKWGGAVASLIKIIAIPPLFGERRWSGLLLAAAAFGATVVLFPGLWLSFLQQAGAVQNTINAQSDGGFSAWGRPLVLIPTVVALIVLARIDLRASAWLVVPALFPTSQYHYAMFALPVDPFLAATMAFPLPLIAPIMTIAYTAVRLGVVMRRRRGSPPKVEAPALGRPQDAPAATGTGFGPSAGL